MSQYCLCQIFNRVNRFATRKEAENAIDLATGRSWGGRKMQVNMAHYGSKEEGQNEVKEPKGIKQGVFLIRKER